MLAVYSHLNDMRDRFTRRAPLWIIVVAAIGCSVLLPACGRSTDTSQSHAVPSLFDKTDSKETILRKLKDHLDSHIGELFPDLELVELSTGRSTKLSEFTGPRLLVFDAGAACGFTKIDMDYYRSRQWQYPGVDQMVVMFAKGRAKGSEIQERCGNDAPIYSYEPPLPDWPGMARTSPLSYLIDIKSQRLLDWWVHPPGAVEEFAPEYSSLIDTVPRSVLSESNNLLETRNTAKEEQE